MISDRATISVPISLEGTTLVASASQDPILLIGPFKQRSMMLMCPFVPNAAGTTVESAGVMIGDVTTVASWDTLQGNAENQVPKIEVNEARVRIKRSRMLGFLLFLKGRWLQDLQLLSQVRSL